MFNICPPKSLLLLCYSDVPLVSASLFCHPRMSNIAFCQESKRGLNVFNQLHPQRQSIWTHFRGIKLFSIQASEGKVRCHFCNLHFTLYYWIRSLLLHFCYNATKSFLVDSFSRISPWIFRWISPHDISTVEFHLGLNHFEHSYLSFTLAELLIFSDNTPVGKQEILPLFSFNPLTNPHTALSLLRQKSEGTNLFIFLSALLAKMLVTCSQ